MGQSPLGGFEQMVLLAAIPERGGKSRRYARVEPEGLEALRESRGMMDALWQGLDPALPEPK